jgi:DNA-binding GntR family transcriptional regulator
MVSRSDTSGRRVLREEIKEHLIDRIVSGCLKPGDRVVELRIAEEFGVSQTPVREALRDLELLGFVVSLPFRGTQVREILPEDLVEIYPIRAALEGIAGRAAVSSIDSEIFDRLETFLAQMREASERGDSHAHVQADIAFHRTIIEASGNKLLMQFWDSMRLETTTFLTMAIARRTLHELAERHTVILAALRSRDPVLVETAMKRHIEEPGEWVRQNASMISRDVLGSGTPVGNDEAEECD